MNDYFREKDMSIERHGSIELSDKEYIERLEESRKSPEIIYKKIDLEEFPAHLSEKAKIAKKITTETQVVKVNDNEKSKNKAIKRKSKKNYTKSD